MKSASVLVAALEVVEERLREPLNVDDLAKACYSSCSGLQKLFGYAFNCPVSEYITKRRLSCATRDLVESGRRIIDIALDYQYSSSEAFSRAFKRFWGVAPSEFRKTRRFTDLFPRFVVETENGGIAMSNRKPVDLSTLYDELKSLGGTFVLSTDLVGFMQINKEYGHAAGDLVLAEAFARIERELQPDMLLFRIGGDEFAVVTALSDGRAAEALARRITARNGDKLKHGGQSIPIVIRIGISRIPTGALSYKKALEIMESSVEEARLAGAYIAGEAE